MIIMSDDLIQFKMRIEITIYLLGVLMGTTITHFGLGSYHDNLRSL